MRRQILTNLIDEEAGSPNHPELWLAFAASVGVSAETAKNAALWEETRALIAKYETICRDRSVEEGLAALTTALIPRTAWPTSMCTLRRTGSTRG